MNLKLGRSKRFKCPQNEGEPKNDDEIKNESAPKNEDYPINEDDRKN